MSKSPELFPLVIDDRFISRQAILWVLASGGRREAYSSDNGLEGLGYLVVKDPSVIVIDVTLPLYDGMEVFEFITTNKRLNGLKKPIVLLHDGAKIPKVKRENAIVLDKRQFGFATALRKCLQLMGIASIKKQTFRERIALPFVEVAHYVSTLAESLWIKSEKGPSLLKPFFGILAAFGDIVSGFSWAIVTLLSSHAIKDANTSQKEKDKHNYRVSVYPAFYTFIGTLLFILLNVWLVAIGGLRIADVRLNGLFAMSDMDAEVAFVSGKESDFVYNSDEIVFTTEGARLKVLSPETQTEVTPEVTDESLSPSITASPTETIAPSPSLTITATPSETVTPIPSMTTSPVPTTTSVTETPITTTQIIQQTDTPTPSVTEVLGESTEASYRLAASVIQIKKQITYSSLLALEEKSSENDESSSKKDPTDFDSRAITYQLSPDGETWYTYDSAEEKWDSSSLEGGRVTIQEANKYLSKYTQTYPSGDLYLRVFLQTPDATKTPVLQLLSVTRIVTAATTLTDAELENIEEETISTIDFSKLETVIFNASYAGGNKIVKGKLLLKDKKTKAVYEVTDEELANYKAIIYYSNKASASRGEVIGETSLYRNSRGEIEFLLKTKNRAGGYVTAEIVAVDNAELKSGLAKPVENSTFVVDSTSGDADATPGDGLCATASGVCSLRAAIQETNTLPSADIINFNIPTSDSGFRDYDDPLTPNSGDGVGGDDFWKIQPRADQSMFGTNFFYISGYEEVEYLENPIQINGSSQEAISGVDMNIYGPDIEIDGRLGTTSTTGFYLSNTPADGSFVGILSGLVINNFKSTQIRSSGAWTIDANYLCTDIKGETNVISLSLNPDGSLVSTSYNRSGISSGGYYAKFKNNLIHSCYLGLNSVDLDYGEVTGNKIGVDRSGMHPKTMYQAFYSSELERFTKIGDAGEQNRNIFRGNLTSAITGSANVAGPLTITNNYFGVAADGVTKLESSAFILAGYRIADNVSSTTLTVAGPEITNNYVGTSPVSPVNFANPGTGMVLSLAYASSNLHGNVVKNNSVGISIAGTLSPTVANNIIDNNGTGITIESSSTNLFGNEIKNNTRFGIKLTPTSSIRTTASVAQLSTAIIGGTASHSGSLCEGLRKNCIENNGYGGIYLLDTLVTNESSLWTDNNFGSAGNGSDVDSDGKGDRNIEQAWYGLFELFSTTYRRTELSSPVSVPFPTGAIIRVTDNPTELVTSATTLTTNCITATTDCPATGHTVGTLNKTSHIVPQGATATILTTPSSWFRITEYIIDGQGSKTNYGALKFEQNHFASNVFSFDANSTTNPANGYSNRTISSQTYQDRGEPWTNSVSANRTGTSLGRFQIMEVEYVDANPVVQEDGSYVITVDSTDDQYISTTVYFNDGAGASSGGLARTQTSFLANGKTSLREAVLVAKSFTLGAVKKIVFAIPTTDPGYRDYDLQDTVSSGDSQDGDDFWKINITQGDLPFISGTQTSIWIDGTTQTSFGGNKNEYGPEIEITAKEANSGSATAIYHGLAMGTSVGEENPSRHGIKGVAINGFSQNILIQSGKASVIDNYLCTDVKGEPLAPAPVDEFGFPNYNTYGLGLSGYYTLASGNLINGCEYGIDWNADYSKIEGNIIGLDRTATEARPMTFAIYSIEAERYSYLGGEELEKRNYLRGDQSCAYVGAYHVNVPTNNDLSVYAVNNYCGVSKNGEVSLTSGGLTLTGLTQIKNNVSSAPMIVSALDVSGNIVGTNQSKTAIFENPMGIGITYSGGGTFSNNTVYNQHIGIKNLATNDLNNNDIQSNDIGIMMQDQSGTSTGESEINGNYFRQNQTDIEISNSDATVSDNEFSNTKDTVIKVTNNSSRVKINSNKIESTELLKTPVNLAGGNENTKNQTANDNGDSDTGPNNLQNYPEITEVRYLQDGKYSIKGRLDNTVSGESPFVIEICESDKNPSGYGGCLQTLETLTNILTGTWETEVTVPGSDGTDGKAFTALATNAIGQTSEFSPYVAYVPIQPTEVIAGYPISITYPKANVEVAGKGIHFDWTESSDPNLKHYEIYLDSKFYKVVAATETEYISTDELTPAGYTWQVIAIRNDNSVSARSEIAHFTVMQEGATFKLQYPVRIEINTNRPLMGWTSYRGAESYRLIVDNRIIAENIKDLTYKIPEYQALQNGRTYEWYVEAINERGAVLSTTTVESFFVTGDMSIIPAKGVVIYITPSMWLIILVFIVLIYVIAGIFLYRSTEILNLFIILLRKDKSIIIKDLITQKRIMFARAIARNQKHKTVFDSRIGVTGTLDINLKSKKFDTLTIIAPGYHQYEKSTSLIEGKTVYLKKKEVVDFREMQIKFLYQKRGAITYQLGLSLISITMLLSSVFLARHSEYLPWFMGFAVLSALYGLLCALSFFFRIDEN